MNINYNQPRRVLAFDFGGVIIPYLDDVVDTYIQTVLDINTKTFQTLWLQYAHLLITGKVTEAIFWKLIERSLGRPINTHYIFMEKYIEHLIINQEMLYELESRKSHYRLAVFSNSIAPHSMYNRSIGLYDMFDDIFLSDEIGYMKPDPSFYIYVMEKLDVPADQITFFDDKHENIVAASKMGIDAHLYTSNDGVLGHLHNIATR